MNVAVRERQRPLKGNVIVVSSRTGWEEMEIESAKRLSSSA